MTNSVSSNRPEKFDIVA